jgi:hypothetical protein
VIALRMRRSLPSPYLASAASILLASRSGLSSSTWWTTQRGLITYGLRSGSSPDWLKMKNSDAPATKRERRTNEEKRNGGRTG